MPKNRLVHPEYAPWSRWDSASSPTGNSQVYHPTSGDVFWNYFHFLFEDPFRTACLCVLCWRTMMLDLWYWGQSDTPPLLPCFNYLWQWGQSDLLPSMLCFNHLWHWGHRDKVTFPNFVKTQALWCSICDIGDKVTPRHWCCVLLICDIGDKVTSPPLMLSFNYLWHRRQSDMEVGGHTVFNYLWHRGQSDIPSVYDIF